MGRSASSEDQKYRLLRY